jgi:hypothetical protein
MSKLWGVWVEPTETGFIYRFQLGTIGVRSLLSYDSEEEAMRVGIAEKAEAEAFSALVRMRYENDPDLG